MCQFAKVCTVDHALLLITQKHHNYGMQNIVWLLIKMLSVYLDPYSGYSKKYDILSLEFLHVSLGPYSTN